MSGHTWSSDEPTEPGGTNTGSSPCELLLGSLAACTSITVSMYAQRKGWDVDRIVSHVRIHGELDDGQRERLAHVAANCPAYKTLEKGDHLVDHVTFG